jgi:hypothetical protein
MNFNTLNNNLNEYNLVRECIKYVGEPIDKQYERIKDKLDDEEPYKTECFSYEFLEKYQKELFCYYFVLNIDDIIKNSGMNKKDFLKKNKKALEYLFDDDCEYCNICFKTQSYNGCLNCPKGYCEDCIRLTNCMRITNDYRVSTCPYCDLSNFELYMKSYLDKIRKEILLIEEDKRRKKKEKEEREINKRIITNMLQKFKKEDIIDIISDNFNYNEIKDIFDN